MLELSWPLCSVKIHRVEQQRTHSQQFCSEEVVREQLVHSKMNVYVILLDWCRYSTG